MKTGKFILMEKQINKNYNIKNLLFFFKPQNCREIRVVNRSVEEASDWQSNGSDFVPNSWYIEDFEAPVKIKRDLSSHFLE